MSNKLACSEMRKRKAHKLRSSKVSNLTGCEDDKRTEWQDGKMTIWQNDRMTGWQDNSMTKVAKCCQKDVKHGEVSNSWHTSPNFTKRCHKLPYIATNWQKLSKAAKTYQKLATWYDDIMTYMMKWWHDDTITQTWSSIAYFTFVTTNTTAGCVNKISQG